MTISSAAFQANRYLSGNYTGKIAASLVAMEFAIYVLIPEDTNLGPKVWGGCFGVCFALVLEDEFRCEAALCFLK